MGFCFSCYKECADGYSVCWNCGAVIDQTPVEPIHLYPGTILANRYYIGRSVGSGGFGIIYLAWDRKLETVVAVKEFFVSRIMTRTPGQKAVIVNRKSAEEYYYRKERFIAEARTMARFGAHRNIPNIFELIEENGTAYIVMEYLEGQALNEFMKDNGAKIDRDFAIMITHEVGNALISLHDNNIIHRDVAPDNIFICSGMDLRIKLLDLGAAKLADSTDQAIDIILKPGYSPPEQYDDTNNIGPWTDVYALGATLYVMITGVKPDESTNRKIEDTVIAPHEIDPSIPENLSNAIMKAMAVETHMRFRNVPEFLKAVDGGKKTLDLMKEKKRRFRRRLIGIAAAVILLIAAGFGVYKYFDLKRSVQVLKDADITVWFCAESGSDEETAMRAVLDDFMGTFPNVNIKVTCLPENMYYQALRTAADNNTLPDLFESTGVSKDILAGAMDVTDVLNSDQAKDCLFLDKYDRYYSDRKVVPLGIEVPIAYVITGGSMSVEYYGETFSSISDFGETPIAIDSKYSELIDRNFTGNATASKVQFMNNEANECAVLISSSMELNEIRSTLTNYEKKYVYYNADSVQAAFTYEWSIGGGNVNEVAAAKRLLSWMLGNNYQNMLMISRCSDGQIPINEECFNSKTSIKYYAPLKNIYKKYNFDR